MNSYPNHINKEAIVAKYFSNPAKCLHLDKGEILMEQGQINNRLYFMTTGKVCGYLPDKRISEPIFEASDGSFVGVYSFFSEDHKSYTQVIAEKKTTFFYYDENPFDLPYKETEKLLSFLFKIIIIELRSRQNFAGQMAREQESYLHQLIKSEKLALLGQMSAGLAHELNNTIGSLTSNILQIDNDIFTLLIKDKNDEIKAAYNKGLKEGQQLSSKQARNKRKDWERIPGLDKSTIKKLAKSNLDPNSFKKENDFTDIAAAWSLGHIIHDMRIASDQAAHVISSVKKMGISKQKWSTNVDINHTVSDALAILRSMTRRIDLQIELTKEIPLIEACYGELVQVWINIIKNAVESLLNHEVEQPTICIKTYLNDGKVTVSIEDNGKGISKKTIEKIYDPNFTTKVKGLSLGLGLGLTIVQRIVDEHHGDIKLSSVPGKTRFEVFFNKDIISKGYE